MLEKLKNWHYFYNRKKNVKYARSWYKTHLTNFIINPIAQKILQNQDTQRFSASTSSDSCHSCKNKKFHNPTLDCKCELYQNKSERYHIVNCENRTKTITEYSKEWTIKDKQFKCIFVRNYTLLFLSYNNKNSLPFRHIANPAQFILPFGFSSNVLYWVYYHLVFVGIS